MIRFDNFDNFYKFFGQILLFLGKNMIYIWNYFRHVWMSLFDVKMSVDSENRSLTARKWPVLTTLTIFVNS